MKWYNKDKTVCLNLDLIALWAYKEGAMEIYIGHSSPIIFNGEEAKELYNKLTSAKEIL
jgi:hypothetical protein